MTFIDKLTVLYYWDIYGWTVLLYLLLLGMNSVATQFIQIQTRFEQFILQIIVLWNNSPSWSNILLQTKILIIWHHW